MELGELRRVVQCRGIPVQGLDPGRPGVGEIGVDRQPVAVDDPGSGPIKNEEIQ
jgi:hypothetical protein